MYSRRYHERWELRDLGQKIACLRQKWVLRTLIALLQYLKYIAKFSISSAAQLCIPYLMQQDRNATNCWHGYFRNENLESDTPEIT